MDRLNKVTIKNCLGDMILDWIDSILGKEVIDEILQLYKCNDIIDVLAWLYITACGIKRKEVREKFENSMRDMVSKYSHVAWELISNAEFHRNEKLQDIYVRFSVYDGCTGEGLYILISIITGKWICYSDGVADGEYSKEYDELYSERVQEWLKLNIPELAVTDAE